MFLVKYFISKFILQLHVALYRKIWSCPWNYVEWI